MRAAAVIAKMAPARVIPNFTLFIGIFALCFPKARYLRESYMESTHEDMTGHQSSHVELAQHSCLASCLGL